MVATTDDVIEDVLSLEGGIRRYPTDVYFGSGAWPVLTASLGLHHVACGDMRKARRDLAEWIVDRFDGATTWASSSAVNSVIPFTTRSGWICGGQPAQDLTWSHAMFVWLALTLTAKGP